MGFWGKRNLFAWSCLQKCLRLHGFGCVRVEDQEDDNRAAANLKKLQLDNNIAKMVENVRGKNKRQRWMSASGYWRIQSLSRKGWLWVIPIKFQWYLGPSCALVQYPSLPTQKTKNIYYKKVKREDFKPLLSCFLSLFAHFFVEKDP